MFFINVSRLVCVCVSAGGDDGERVRSGAGDTDKGGCPTGLSPCFSRAAIQPLPRLPPFHRHARCGGRHWRRVRAAGWFDQIRPSEGLPCPLRVFRPDLATSAPLQGYEALAAWATLRFSPPSLGRCSFSRAAPAVDSDSGWHWQSLTRCGTSETSHAPPLSHALPPYSRRIRGWGMARFTCASTHAA